MKTQVAKSLTGFAFCQTQLTFISKYAVSRGRGPFVYGVVIISVKDRAITDGMFLSRKPPSSAARVPTPRGTAL